jgi:aminopeptidase YwaD
MKLWWLGLFCSIALAFSIKNDANKDVQALVAFGPRVSGSQNLEKAANYLQTEYKKIGASTTIEPFTFERIRDLGSSVTVNNKRLPADTLYSSSITDIEGLVVRIPNFGSRADYKNLDLKTRIALVKRGGITFLEKARAALEAGAIGMVLVNSVPGRLSANLLGDFQIPVVAISGTDGTPLLEQAAKGTLRLRLISDVRRVEAIGKNVVAKFSNTPPKLILGAHFDSVPGSPGANDNASGTAAILEMARRLEPEILKQIWFVSFDAEEDGLIGSNAFVQTLPTSTLDGLKAMLNFDMIAVNNTISVGGSSQLIDLVRSIHPNIGQFNDFAGSDHASFLAEGVPSLFFWRGFEPNYHLPADSQVNPQLLEETIQIGLETIRKLIGEK